MTIVTTTAAGTSPISHQKVVGGRGGNKNSSPSTMRSKKTIAPRVRTVGGPATNIFVYVPSSSSAEEAKGALKEFQTTNWVEHSKPVSALKSASDYYFQSYAHFGIHEEMLKDSIRTGAYQRAIMDNSHLFKDKIVLDVGAGTGVLSMFAAKAGAKHVYSIECSEIIHLGRQLVEDNGLADKVTLIQEKAEDLNELPDGVEKVDIIISEWMGYFLLYESMLDTVLHCRDKWLKKDGLIFPDKATMHMAGIEDGDYQKEKFNFWNNCYDLDFSRVKECLLEEPTVDIVQGEAVVTDPCCILTLDLNTCTVADATFASHFKLRCTKRDFVHAMIVWFDVTFSCCHVPVVFSTGPFNHYTHWKQTVFYLRDPITAEQGEEVTGMIAVRKSSKNHRELDIKMLVELDGRHTSYKTEQYHCLR